MLGVQKSRIRKRAGFLLLFALSALASPAFSETSVASFRQAADACLTSPLSREGIAERLKGTEWRADAKAGFRALFSIQVAHDWDQIRPGYSYENGHFMAVSILGNSGMPPNQPSFTTGDAYFAVLNIEQTPYCLLSGPRALKDAAAEVLGLTEYEAKDIRLIAKTDRDNQHIYIAIVDENQARPLIRAAPEYFNPDREMPFEEFNLLITSR